MSRKFITPVDMVGRLQITPNDGGYKALSIHKGPTGGEFEMDTGCNAFFYGHVEFGGTIQFPGNVESDLTLGADSSGDYWLTATELRLWDKITANTKKARIYYDNGVLKLGEATSGTGTITGVQINNKLHINKNGWHDLGTPSVLMVGPTDGHLLISEAGIQAEQSGEAAAIFLNEYGGEVYVGGEMWVTPPAHFDGGIELPWEDPVDEQQAANKRYVDSKAGITEAAGDLRYLQLSGGALTGSLVIDGPNPGLTVIDTTSGYPGINIGDGGSFYIYGSETLAIHGGPQLGYGLIMFKVGNEEVIPLSLDNMGAYFSVPATLPGDPTDGLHAATKQYVDARPTGMDQATADTRYLQLAGGTLTGDVESTSMITADYVYTHNGLSTDTTLWVGEYADIVGNLKVESNNQVALFGTPAVSVGQFGTDCLQFSPDSIQNFVAGVGGPLKLNPLGGGVSTGLAQFTNPTDATMLKIGWNAGAVNQYEISVDTARRFSLAHGPGGTNGEFFMYPTTVGWWSSKELTINGYTDMAFYSDNGAVQIAADDNIEIGLWNGTTLKLEGTSVTVDGVLSVDGASSWFQSQVDVNQELRLINGPLNLGDWASVTFGMSGVTYNTDYASTQYHKFKLFGTDKFTINNTLLTATVPIALPADPASALHAATKQYVDGKAGITQTAADARYLQLTGGTITSDLTVADELTANGYSNFNAGANIAGVDIPNGDVTINSDGTEWGLYWSLSGPNNGARVVHDNTNGLRLQNDKPSEPISFHVRNAANTAPVSVTLTDTLLTSGVPIALPANPASALHAATKQYVDTNAGITQATADTRYSPLRQTQILYGSSGYTPMTADENKLILLASATAQNVTVVPNATVPIPLGYRIDIAQYGDGQITIVSGGVTLIATPGLKLRAKGSVVSLIKTADPDTWLCTGDLTI